MTGNSGLVEHGMAGDAVQQACGAADLEDDRAAAGDASSRGSKCAGAGQARQDAGHRDPLAPLKCFQQAPHLHKVRLGVMRQLHEQASTCLRFCRSPSAPWHEFLISHKYNCQLP